MSIEWRNSYNPVNYKSTNFDVGRNTISVLDRVRQQKQRQYEVESNQLKTMADLLSTDRARIAGEYQQAHNAEDLNKYREAQISHSNKSLEETIRHNKAMESYRNTPNTVKSYKSNYKVTPAYLKYQNALESANTPLPDVTKKEVEVDDPTKVLSIKYNDDKGKVFREQATNELKAIEDKYKLPDGSLQFDGVEFTDSMKQKLDRYTKLKDSNPKLANAILSDVTNEYNKNRHGAVIGNIADAFRVTPEQKKLDEYRAKYNLDFASNNTIFNNNDKDTIQKLGGSVEEYVKLKEAADKSNALASKQSREISGDSLLRAFNAKQSYNKDMKAFNTKYGDPNYVQSKVDDVVFGKKKVIKDTTLSEQIDLLNKAKNDYIKGQQSNDPIKSMIVGIESDPLKGYQSSNSSGAYGLFQIMPNTYKHISEMTGKPVEYLKTPQGQEEAYSAYIDYNKKMLDRQGINSSNPFNVYVAWNLGAGAVKEVINPNVEPSETTTKHMLNQFSKAQQKELAGASPMEVKRAYLNKFIPLVTSKYSQAKSAVGSNPDVIKKYDKAINDTIKRLKAIESSKAKVGTEKAKSLKEIATKKQEQMYKQATEQFKADMGIYKQLLKDGKNASNKPSLQDYIDAIRTKSPYEWKPKYN